MPRLHCRRRTAAGGDDLNVVRFPGPRQKLCLLRWSEGPSGTQPPHRCLTGPRTCRCLALVTSAQCAMARAAPVTSQRPARGTWHVSAARRHTAVTRTLARTGSSSRHSVLCWLCAPHSCTLVLAHGTKQMMVMMMMICSMVLMIADLDDATGNRGEEPKIRK